VKLLLLFVHGYSDPQTAQQTYQDFAGKGISLVICCTCSNGGGPTAQDALLIESAQSSETDCACSIGGVDQQQTTHWWNKVRPISGSYQRERRERAFAALTA
jgi:hypothetical protein